MEYKTGDRVRVVKDVLCDGGAWPVGACGAVDCVSIDPHGFNIDVKLDDGDVIAFKASELEKID